MKKFFSFVAVLCVALTASASVVWTETLDKNGTYINRDGKDKDTYPWGTYWPYVDQWYEVGNFVNEYDSVGSQNVSIRSKKLNSDTNNTIGFFFAATTDKYPTTDSKLYLKGKDGVICTGNGLYLTFEVCTSESDGGDLTALQVQVNDKDLTIPEKKWTGKAQTVTVSLPLEDGDVASIYIYFKDLPKNYQKFITNLRIEDQPTAIGNTTVAEKAVKTIENGQLVIVRNGVKYNAVGAVVE